MPGEGDQPVRPERIGVMAMSAGCPDDFTSDLTQPADPEWADRLDAAYGPEKGQE